MYPRKGSRSEDRLLQRQTSGPMIVSSRSIKVSILTFACVTVVVYLIFLGHNTNNLSKKWDRIDNIITKDGSTDDIETDHTIPVLISGVNLVNDLQSLYYLDEPHREIGDKQHDLIAVSESNPPQQSNVTPILVIACNRISVKRNLDQLIRYRPSNDTFPIIVSQDCNHSPTRDVLRSYGDKIKLYQHTNTSEIKLLAKQKRFVDYYKISRHYKWALNKIFNELKYPIAIIVEDDLDISPDFFEYFQGLRDLLFNDKSLYCISAWNDNGMQNLVNVEEPELLYRTDFFPGLGWMLTNATYQELSSNWPDAFWDDWIRKPEQRRNRSCIRPEISRTKTFGKVGASNGQFFDSHLKLFNLNKHFVPFTRMNLSYLHKNHYDQWYHNKVYQETVETTLLPVTPGNGILKKESHRPSTNVPANRKTLFSGATTMNSANCTLLLKYSNYTQLTQTCERLNLMTDLKSGVSRTAYQGIISTFVDNCRIYIAPDFTWTDYDLNADM